MERVGMGEAEKYLKVFHLAVIHSLKNYKALIGLSLFLITCMFIFAHLWKFAAAKTGAITYQPDQLLWYIAFNEWVIISLPDIQEEIELDLRSGKLAYMLPRPISYLCATFFEGLGMLTVNLFVLGIVTFSFTWVSTGNIPLGASAFPLTLAIGLLAGCVGLIFQMLIGISAFWLRDVSPFHWVWEKLLYTLGGLMLPLAVYPEWMQAVASLTPFPAILGDRSALAIHFSSEDAFSVIAILAFWGTIGLACLVFFYRRGLRILNIEGG